MADLFSNVETAERSQYGTVPVRATAAAADPATSHQAAQRMNVSGKVKGNALAVLRLVRIKPGATAVELFAKYEELRPIGTWPPLDRVEIGRRLDSLVKAGLVRKGPVRECLVNRTPMLTWEAVKVEDAEAESSHGE